MLKKGIPVYTANRLQRWALILLAYDFEIKYTNTKEFGHADVLSRLISDHEKPSDEYIVASVSIEEDIRRDLDSAVSTLTVSFNMIVNATTNDDTLQKVIHHMNTEWPESSKHVESTILPYFNRKESLAIADGCLMFNNRIIIPDPYRQKILKQLHKGHLSAERCKSIARSYVLIDRQIEDYVRQCQNCQHAAKNPVRTDLCSWPITSRPLERIHIDYAGPVKSYYCYY